jgi:ABC-2 type transport system ATP-binding protein
MPEDECLFPAVPGVGFVAYAGELCGMASSDAMQRAHEVLNYVGLDEARYRPVESYSTGMKQRLKLAAAIVHDPKLLILDEPTNGMDPAGRQEIIELARDLSHGKGMSLLFSSHLLPDVEAVCDTVLVLGRGALLAQGNIQEMKQAHPRSFDVRIKEESGDFLNRLRAAGAEAEPHDDVLRVQLPVGQTSDLFWRLAADTGKQIRYLRPHRSSLEDVFLEAVGK